MSTGAKTLRTQGNRSERRARTIHRDRIFGGQTAEEVHQQYAFPVGAKCKCGRRPMTTFRTFIELSELRKQDSHFQMLERLDPAGVHAMTVFFKDSAGAPVPYVKMNTVYACKDCTPMAEKQAAQGPSWYVVEIARGPGPERLVSMASPEATATVEDAVANMPVKEN